MGVHKKYVVYEFNNVMGSEKHKALEKVQFKGMVYNSFDCEDDAIQALVNEDKRFKHYVILKEIYIN